jgi:polysaccharide biosynthesis transport protein
MLDQSIACENLSTQLPAKRWFREKLRFAVCALSALAVIAAAARLASADGFDWGSGKVSASAYLRLALADKPPSFSGGQNLQIEFEIFKNTQKQLITSPMVLRTALKQPGISDLEVIKKQKDPLDWLGRNLQVTTPANAEIMQVSLSGASPEELATLVNAVVDAYMAEVVDADRRVREDRIRELKDTQIRKAQEIKDSLNDLRKMADSLGVAESEMLNQRQKNLLDELSSFRVEVIRGQFELNRMFRDLVGEKAKRDAEESQPITDLEVQLTCPSDTVLHELEKQLVELQTTSESVGEAVDSSGESPAAKTAAKKMARVKDRYAARIEMLKMELAAKKKAETEREIRKIEAVIEIAKKQQDAAQAELKQLRKEADRIGVTTIDMQMRRAEIANAQKALDAVTGEIEKLQLELRAVPRISLLEKAEVPEQP